jgi:hemolysin III
MENQEQIAEQIPQRKMYTKGEEIFNAVSHIVGGALGIAGLIFGVIFAGLNNKPASFVVGMVIYSISMILVYTMSAIYHFLRPNRAKRLFRIFDHCSIFLLIAGTYTAICLGGLVHSEKWAWVGWTLFGTLWGLSIVGITLNAINMKHKAVKIFSYSAYLIMGWCAVIFFKPVFEVLTLPGFLLILGGGIIYTLGVLLYAFGKKVRYFHSVWHLFVLAGTIVQFFGILFYVMLPNS